MKNTNTVGQFPLVCDAQQTQQTDNRPCINGIALPTLDECRTAGETGKGLSSNAGKAALYHCYAEIIQIYNGKDLSNLANVFQLALVCAGHNGNTLIKPEHVYTAMVDVTLPSKVNGLACPTLKLRAPSRLKGLVKAIAQAEGNLSALPAPDMNKPRLSAPKKERKPSKEETKIRSMSADEVAKWQENLLASLIKKAAWAGIDAQQLAQAIAQA